MSELIDLTLAPAELAGVHSLLGSLEDAMPFLVSLTAEQVKALFKLGPQSEAFVRKTLEAAEQHPRLLPASNPVAAMQRDAALREALRPIRARVAALLEMLDGTMMLAGADLMKSASAVYRTLRIHGKGEGVEDLLEDLGKRFAKRRKVVRGEASAAEPPSAGEPLADPAAADIPILAEAAPPDEGIPPRQAPQCITAEPPRQPGIGIDRAGTPDRAQAPRLIARDIHRASWAEVEAASRRFPPNDEVAIFNPDGKKK